METTFASTIGYIPRQNAARERGVIVQAKKRTLKAPTETGKVSRGEIRAAVRAVHVMPKPGEGWEVRKSGEGRLTHQFPSKRDALEFARSVGKQRKAELIIHGRDGRIQRVDSYGPDPLPPRATTRAR